MSTQRFALVLVVSVAAAALLLSLADVYDSVALAVGGCAFLLLLAGARLHWSHAGRWERLVPWVLVLGGVVALAFLSSALWPR